MARSCDAFEAVAHGLLQISMHGFNTLILSQVLI